MTVAHDLIAQKQNISAFFWGGGNLNDIQVRTLVLPAIVVPQCFQSTHGTCVFVLSHLSPVNSISHSGCMSLAFKWGGGCLVTSGFKDACPGCACCLSPSESVTAGCVLISGGGALFLMKNVSIRFIFLGVL